jgi:hypothetical protein
MQEPALQEIIAGMERGDWSTLLVTDSSRIDRREDLDAQAAVLLAIRAAGGDVISLTEPNYGQTDFAGRIVTLVAQHANAEKSKTVKNSTYRGISMIRDNRLPGWLQAWVRVNPVTALASATRGLMLNGPVATPAWHSVAWSIAITVVFAPLAVRRYRHIG